MKLGILLAVFLMVCFAEASQPVCRVTMGKNWQVTLSGYGVDYGVEGMHNNTYVRRPSQTVASESAAQSLNDDMSMCAEACEYNGGTFATSTEESKCRYESNWPYFWECFKKLQVACN